VGVDCTEGSPEIRGSHLLLAVGRRPNTDDLGLDRAGIAQDEHGFIVVDDQLRTNVPGVWALGGPITDISAVMKRIANFWPPLDDPVRLRPPRDAVAAADDALERRGLCVDRLYPRAEQLIGDNDTINAQTLPNVKLPNRDEFIVRFPDAM
jgi:hypothetical protein